MPVPAARHHHDHSPRQAAILEKYTRTQSWCLASSSSVQLKAREPNSIICTIPFDCLTVCLSECRPNQRGTLGYKKFTQEESEQQEQSRHLHLAKFNLSPFVDCYLSLSQFFPLCTARAIHLCAALFCLLVYQVYCNFQTTKITALSAERAVAVVHNRRIETFISSSGATIGGKPFSC